MPSILSHPAVPLAVAAIAGTKRIGGRLLVAGVIASVLPDADVLAFRFGVAYGSELGHRGFSHSLFFAVMAGAIACACAPWLRASRFTAFLFVGLSCASHGLLDMLTNGGHGIAYFWPFTDTRYFLPARVIEVSPLSVRRFLGPAGWDVIVSELRWIWLPALALAAPAILVRRRRRAPSREVR